MQRDDVAGGEQVGQWPPAGVAVVAGAGVQHVGTHRATTIVSTRLRDVAVADQPDRAAADVAHRLAEGRIRRPAPALARRAVERRQPAQRGEHQQHGALGDRRGVGAGHVGHRDAEPRRGVDVDGVHPGAQLVHELESGRLLQVATRQGPQHVPDHVGVGQLAVEGVVVVLGAVPDVEPIRLWGKEFSDLVAGGEVGEDLQRHRFAIHLAIVSACSLRAPGVVK